MTVYICALTCPTDVFEAIEEAATRAEAFSDTSSLSRINGADLGDALSFAEQVVDTLPRGFDPTDSRHFGNWPY